MDSHNHKMTVHEKSSIQKIIYFFVFFYNNPASL